MNRHPWDVWHAAPSEAPGMAPRGGPDESLVVDARAGLTPADVVERALRYRLRGGAVAGSHVRMGPARSRGRRRAEAPAPRGLAHGPPARPRGAPYGSCPAG